MHASVDLGPAESCLLYGVLDGICYNPRDFGFLEVIGPAEGDRALVFRGRDMDGHRRGGTVGYKLGAQVVGSRSKPWSAWR